MNKLLGAIVILVLGLLGFAWAQQYNQPTQIVGNLCAFNSALPTLNTGFPGWMQCDSLGRLIVSPGGAGAAGFPAGATPITAVFSGADTATASATLAAVAGKFTYICGFTVSGLGSTAGATVIATVATLAGGNTLSYSYVFVASATGADTPVNQVFSPCIPASAANAVITATVPGSAGNTATQINAWGYQQ
jgi:hypothetical protein